MNEQEKRLLAWVVLEMMDRSESFDVPPEIHQHLLALGVDLADFEKYIRNRHEQEKVREGFKNIGNQKP